MCLSSTYVAVCWRGQRFGHDLGTNVDFAYWAGKFVEGGCEMTTMEDELKQFTAFVYQRIGSGGASGLGLSELFDLWMLENPTGAQRFPQHRHFGFELVDSGVRRITVLDQCFACA